MAVKTSNVTSNGIPLDDFLTKANPTFVVSYVKQWSL